MINGQLLNSLKESSLFDTYLVYGVIGLLLFVAFIGLIILLITSCCCLYSISCCYCCTCHCRRRSSYELNNKSNVQEDKNKVYFIKRSPNDATDFSKLCESYPHLVNSKPALTSQIPNKNFNASVSTINTLIDPISPCSSFHSLNRPNAPARQLLNNLSQPHIDKIHRSPKGVDARPFAYIKNPNDCKHIMRRQPQCDRSNSPSVVSIDMTRIPSFENDNNNQSNSSCTNIYETVIPTANINSPSDQSTPIYETEWRHSLKQIMMNTIVPIETNVISVAELPSLPSNSVSADNYFQQQNPYEKFLENRTKTSDSMRRANMLKRLNDDAAFLY